ncbi:MAG: SRPBCC family protein [Stagnimonas sp.]|nr:SRPBCC family protein [Stagnimonas sp.]
MRTVVGLLLCLCSTHTLALQLQTLEVSRDDTVYHVVVDVLIEAAPERVRARLLDVSALPQLDPSLKSARATEEAGGMRVESELEECLFGICRRLFHVQQVVAVGNEITAQTLAVQGSSFRSGVAHWQLTAEGAGTRLLFTADTEPDVWLPPFIGPSALMRQLKVKTLASLQNLERLARE